MSKLIETTVRGMRRMGYDEDRIAEYIAVAERREAADRSKAAKQAANTRRLVKRTGKIRRAAANV